MNLSPIYTTKQVAEWLQVSTRTVCDMAQKKQIPAFRAGGDQRGGWRFREDELEQWAKSINEKR